MTEPKIEFWVTVDYEGDHTSSETFTSVIEAVKQFKEWVSVGVTDIGEEGIELSLWIDDDYVETLEHHSFLEDN